MANLAIDIGNTRLKWGLFEGKELRETGAGEAENLENLFAEANNQNIKNVILSNVGKELKKDLEKRFRDRYFFINLDQNTPLPFRNAYKSPGSLGKDRLAAIAGAAHYFPGEHALVIDIGTAITFDYLSADGCFEGGNISPGMAMRYQGMYLFTARLPLIETTAVAEFWGQDTKAAMESGVINGILFEIEGYIRYLEDRLTDFKILLTGGGADYFAKKLKSEIFVDHNLVLTGLNKILDYNVHIEK